MAKARKREKASASGAASGAPGDLGFWARFSAAYDSMRRDGRVDVRAPSRLAHTKTSARMIRGVLDQLAAESGCSTEVFAPYAGDLFFARWYWLAPPDPSGLHPFGGEICLQAVGNLLRPFEPAPGWALFDDHPNAGDGVVTVVRPRDGRWELGLYELGEVTPMDIDVPRYMEALLDLRGAFGWQRLFVPRARAHAAELGTLLDRVGSCFGSDTAAYRARIAK